MKTGEPDANLLKALTEAYRARALLFHTRIAAMKIDLLISEIDAINSGSLKWDLAQLKISPSASEKVKATGAKLHQVFCHPAVIEQRPHLVAYYRNIATISQKGIAQILFPTSRYEIRQSTSITTKKAVQLATTLNDIISGVIEDVPDYRVSVSRKAIYAEIGTELQGCWANLMGKGASLAVERIVYQHLTNRGLGNKIQKGTYQLKNGWSIVFGTEPDVAFFDSRGVKQIAIEIKGSLDVAGAQTRYGEAKKSFAKQLADNPRCYTVYLASCFTDSVIEQIKADGQVRDWFNLTSILYDQTERDHFLERVFYIASIPGR